MSDKVIYLKTILPMTASQVLDGVSKEDMEDLLIIGYDKKGEFKMFSTTSEIGECNLWLDRAKRAFIDMAQENEPE